MRILNITDKIPYPVISGAPLYSYNLIRRLANQHEVWLAAFTTNPEQEAGATRMEEFCQGVITAPLEMKGTFARPFDFLRYILSGRPPDLRFFQSEELSKKLRRLIQEVEFDAVRIEHTHMGLFLQDLSDHLRKRAVWSLHDIDWVKFARIAQLEPRLTRKARVALHAAMMRLWKPRYAATFARCTTISERDRERLLAANPSLQVDVVSTGVDTTVMSPLPDSNLRHSLLFVGDMGYLPNVEAMVYFCEEVLPLIHTEIPDVELWIVGINPLPEIQNLASSNIHVTGRVNDVRPYYERSQVCVIPLHAGGGGRLKILEAMALKRPIVSTTLGIEGQVDLIDGQHIMVADTTEEFAEKTIRLLQDDALRQYIIDTACQHIVTHYDWDIIADKLARILSDVAGSSPGME